jgi:hypothetical protein
VRYELLDLDQAPGAGDGTRCAVFIFETSAPGQFAVISVPGLRLDLVDTAEPLRVNRQAPAVAALIAELQFGIWCNPFGYSLTNCIETLVEYSRAI